MNRLVILLTSLSCLLPGFRAGAQAPSNDNFANSWSMAGTSWTTNGVTFRVATVETGEPLHAGLRNGRSVWFNWTAPTNGTVRIDTLGSDYDTLLGVYLGTNVAGLTTVTGNNDIVSCVVTQSMVVFSAVQGTNYKIAVDGTIPCSSARGSGNYVINLQMLPSVYIATPTDGATVVPGSNLYVRAEAGSPNGTVSSVDMYHNSVLDHTEYTYPYEATFTNLSAGAHSMYAVVTDSASQVWTSAVVNVVATYPRVGHPLIPPVLDGTVDNVWNSTPAYTMPNVILGATNRTGATDLSATWRGLWDESNFYLLVTVTDSVLTNDSSNIWEDDAVEVFFDGDLSRGSSYDGTNDLQYIFGWNDTGFAEYKLSRTNGVSFAQSITTNGYVMEMKFPWTALGVTPASNKIIGFELEIDDDDNGGTRDSKIAWWVSSTNDPAYQNPSSFGMISLAPDTNTLPTTTLVSSNSVWKYLDTGTNLGTAWTAPGFDDSAWASGPAELGYGDSPGRPEATIVSYGPDSNNKYITTYFRRSFVVTNTAVLTNLLLRVLRDDGAVVYLNGVEVARYNMAAGTVTYTTAANNATDDGTVFYPTNVSPTRLVAGTNVLAVEIHQDLVTSSDISFDLELIGQINALINLPPIVSLATPTNGANFVGPDSITLAANASDPDGSVARVEYFSGGVSLGQVAGGSPFAFTWPNVAAGIYTLQAVAMDDRGLKSTSGPVTINLFPTAGSRWVAINDHISGTNTSPFATSWNMLGSAPGASGSLTNIATGEALPTTLTISRSGSVAAGSTGSPPGEGTPAYNLFHNFVTFEVSNSSAGAVITGTNSWINYRFSGLDPNRRYSFRGTGLRGRAGYVDRWLMVTLAGANAFTNAHTTNVLTSAQQPDGWLAANQAAMNTGDNISGDMVGWDGIAPGADGIIDITTTQYLGPAPGNTTPSTYGYALTALWLEEVGSVPLVNVTSPTNGVTFVTPADVAVNASASGYGGVTNLQLFANGAELGSTTSSSLGVVWSNAPAGSNGLVAVGFDSLGGSATSGVVSVSIIAPSNAFAPTITAVLPPGDSVIDNLSTVQVTFSEPVSGVDAADLLINGTPATNLSGSGSSYTFTVAPPSAGQVLVTWATNHGIVDLGLPSRPFDAGGSNATWSYTLVATNLAPTIVAKTPAAGARLTNTLSSVQVVFSEPVSGVEAGDFLVNGVPATGLSGSGAAYTFTFPVPAAGTVQINWATNHSIADLGAEPASFNLSSPGATWTYNLVDTIAPTIVAKDPAAGATVTNLTLIQVAFGEPVIGVDASDLRIGSNPATTLMGSGSNYTFFFPQPATGAVSVTWAASHGITDPSGNPFNAAGAGATWSYSVVEQRTLLVASNAFYRWRPGTNEASNPIDAWRYPGFDDTSWTYAQAPFYYDTDTPATYYGNTLITGMQSVYSCIFLRSQFAVTNLAQFTNLVIRSRIDDGVIVWLNGVEIKRYNLGAGTIPYDDLTPASTAEPLTNHFTRVTNQAALIEGTNVLAAQIFNSSYASSDLQFDLDLSAQVLDPNSQLPRVVVVSPPAGDVYGISNLTVTFSRAVTNVDAADLLVNSVPATGLTGGGADYTFTFPPPPYGLVVITWATNHGITDLSVSSRPFNATAPGNTWQYTSLNPNAPVVVTQNPLAATTINNLTQIQVTFSKAVANIDAADLLLNGTPATALSGSGASHTFTFPQPAYGNVAVTWAVNHGITDLEQPANAFDAGRAGSTWTYTLVDQTSPDFVAQNPPAGTVVTNLTQIQVLFSEPVSGVSAGDLLVNGVPATGLSGSGSNYTFTFPQPNASIIQVTWAASHGITDLAAVPNAFDGTAPGHTWQYISLDNVPPTEADIYPPPSATVRALTQITVNFTEPVSGVGAADLLINDTPAADVIGSAAGPYTFTFPEPVTGVVHVAWALTHGIGDLAAPPNPFAGGAWTYVFNPNAQFDKQIVINEIMFHPSSENPNHEWIELHNRGLDPVNLSGWRFTKGVNFTFPNVTVPGGGYLVVAASLEDFRVRYPGVSNVIGDWVGQLANSDDDIRLGNALGEIVNEVLYADAGDWAVRIRGTNTATPVNTSGWDWLCAADGFGRTLELRNPALPNSSGQNWLSSTVNNGTPGAANSVATNNLPPLILDFRHDPPVPVAGQAVTVSAQVLDEHTNGVTVSLYYRNASTTNPGDFTVVQMFDDGLHLDGPAHDHVFAATIPGTGNTNNAVIEFYIHAEDEEGSVRTWPTPALWSGTNAQVVNALYQVATSAESYGGKQPMYRVIMTESERAFLANLNSTNPNNNSEMNATFIRTDSVGTVVRYNCGFRLRGAGSRGAVPPNQRLIIPSDRRWNGIKGFNLNSQNTHSQYAGSILTRLSGMNSEVCSPVQLRVNGANPAYSGTAPNGYSQYGSYVHIEEIDTDFAAAHFPTDSGGNLYRCMRPSADLTYRGTAAAYISAGYSKQSNVSEDDWSDMNALTIALNTNDAAYVESVRRVLDPLEWARYFAVNVVIGYIETSIGSNGDPDDYSMYCGVNDPRFLIFMHDHDSDFGLQGATTTMSIFRATEGATTSSAEVRRFLKHPAFVPLYFAELKRMLDTTFSPAQFTPALDAALGDWVPSAAITSMKTYLTNREIYIASQIPLTLTISHSLSSSGGYPYVTTPTATLFGSANVIDTRSVLVNGTTATWSAWEGHWTNTVTLQPGLNRVLVQSLNSNAVAFATATVDIWYDDLSVLNVSGSISGNTTWTPAAGPYNVTSTVTVGSGATLTIQPGTTVYLASGASLNVTGTGRLLAEGTDTQRIRFTRPPGTTGTWGNLDFSNTSAESRLSHADIEFANGPQALHATNALIYLDSVSFSNITVQYLTLDNTSFVIRRGVFPSLSGVDLIRGSGLPASGYGIFDGNWFGTTTGLNSIIDFTGGNRPNAILQVLNNTFTAASDDVLKLDGTDAHIEGNTFMHVHQATPGGDTANAISGGQNGADTSELTIVRNLFFDCDHAVLAREGNFYTLENNTILHSTVAAVSFGEPLRGVAGGAGARLNGNIIWDTPLLFENYTSAVMQVTVDRCLLPTNWPGTGNVVADPRLFNTNSATITWATVTNDFRLRSSSPAVGAGPNGLDMGALVPAGASISGEPLSPTARTSVTLTVGGPGVTHYKYRLNSAPFSVSEVALATPIVLSGLTNGAYTVSVIGKNSAGVWQSEANATVSRTWTVDATRPGVRLNELLAANNGAVVHFESTPDVIELFNNSSAPAALSGLRLTDNPLNPDKFTFASGTEIPAEGYLVLFADNDTTPGIHLGFNLSKSGGSLYLYDSVAGGGALLDSVAYGLQVEDLSIGRLADGNWALTLPTFGAANQRASTGDPTKLKINEWLAAEASAYSSDFVELFNPEVWPVALGGLYLTDAPIGWPTQNMVAPLSFIPATGYALFKADANPGAGADHLNFTLAHERGELALLSSDLTIIDQLIYGQQSLDLSEGRSPNGGGGIVSLTPTPGSGNPTPSGTTNIVTTTINLVNWTNAWRYEASGTDLGTNWLAPGYNDSAWSNGLAMFWHGPNTTFPFATNTPLPFTDPIQTTFYFRTHFNIATDTNGFNLSISSAIDDGMVMHLNGREIYRYNMPAGAISYTNFASSSISSVISPVGPVVTNLAGLVMGDNVLAVEVHQGTASSSDIGMAVSLDLTKSVTNITGTGIVLNEVMANSQSLTNADGSVTDWVEFYNPGGQAAGLANFSLTDDPANPRRWVFPAGVTIPATGYLVVRCDGGTPATTNDGPLLNTGFGLKTTGGGLYLYDTNVVPALAASVVYGLQTADFSIGRVPNGSGAWVLTQPTPASANLPVSLGNTATLKVNEWMAAHSDNSDDWFEIWNPGAQPVALGGLHLTDDLNNRTKFTIPALSFLGVATNGYQIFRADKNTSAGADHVGFKLPASSGAIGLATAGGDLIDGVSYGTQQEDVSEGRFPDGSATIARFPQTDSPGASNYRLLTNAVINEMLAHTFLPFEDAIELRNLTAQPVDIGGWWLSDAAKTLRKYRIPDGTTLAADGYAVFYAYEFDSDPINNPLSFGLSASKGDEVYLSTGDGAGNLTGWRASVKFGASENGVSFGRYVSSDGNDQFVAMTAHTFGQDDPGSVDQFRLGLGLPNAAPKVGPIVITEIMYHPPNLGTNDNNRDEFIELYNTSSAPVPLFDPNFPTNTWRFRDAVDYNFPMGVTLPAGSYVLVVSFDPAADPVSLAAFRSTYNLGPSVTLFGPYLGKLANSTAKVELYKPDAPLPVGDPDAGYVPYVLVERVKYADTAPWPTLADGFGYSLQRISMNSFGNDPTNWLAALPTPAPLTEADSDGDGMPDAWETAHGFNPSDPSDANLDPDHDGLTNLQEYLAGTDPHDAASVLKLGVANGGVEAGTNTVLVFPGVAGKSYTVEWSELLPAGWVNLINLDPLPVSGPVWVTNALPASTTQRFYRVVTPRR